MIHKDSQRLSAPPGRVAAEEFALAFKNGVKENLVQKNVKEHSWAAAGYAGSGAASRKRLSSVPVSGSNSCVCLRVKSLSPRTARSCLNLRFETTPTTPAESA